MKKSKICIYCGSSAKSLEHVFPANCGGLRQATGIVCGTCNGEFGGTLDKVLQEQLNHINGLLGVQDRHRAKQSTTYIDDASKIEYRVNSMGEAAINSPILTEKVGVNGSERQVDASFANQRQLESWIHAERSKGSKITWRTGPRVRKSFAPRGLTRHARIGGDLLIRESARIALNYAVLFENYHNASVHNRNEYNDIKNYIKIGPSPSKKHGYVSAYMAEQDLPINSFDFGHRVTLVFDASKSRMFAYVEYFSSASFLVDIASLPLSENKTLIIDIDPIADSEPNDIKVRCLDHAIEFCPVDDSTDQDSFAERIEKRGMLLLKNVHERQTDNIISSLHARLLKVEADINNKTEEAACRILGDFDALILSRITQRAQIVVASLKSHSENLPVDSVVNMLERFFIDGFPGTNREIPEATLKSMEIIQTNLSKIIVQNAFHSNPSNKAYLRSMLIEDNGFLDKIVCEMLIHVVRVSTSIAK